MFLWTDLSRDSTTAKGDVESAARLSVCAGDTDLFSIKVALRSLIGSLWIFCAPLSLSPDKAGPCAWQHLGGLGCDVEVDEISFRSKTVGERVVWIRYLAIARRGSSKNLANSIATYRITEAGKAAVTISFGGQGSVFATQMGANLQTARRRNSPSLDREVFDVEFSDLHLAHTAVKHSHRGQSFETLQVKEWLAVIAFGWGWDHVCRALCLSAAWISIAASGHKEQDLWKSPPHFLRVANTTTTPLCTHCDNYFPKKSQTTSLRHFSTGWIADRNLVLCQSKRKGYGLPKHAQTHYLCKCLLAIRARKFRSFRDKLNTFRVHFSAVARAAVYIGGRRKEICVWPTRDLRKCSVNTKQNIFMRMVKQHF